MGTDIAYRGVFTGDGTRLIIADHPNGESSRVPNYGTNYSTWITWGGSTRCDMACAATILRKATGEIPSINLVTAFAEDEIRPLAPHEDWYMTRPYIMQWLRKYRQNL